VGFNCFDFTDHTAEVGFDLHRLYWRRGIMTEALSAILRFGFITMRLNRVGASLAAYNEFCHHLLLKLQFLQEGTQREQYFENGA